MLSSLDHKCTHLHVIQVDNLDRDLLSRHGVQAVERVEWHHAGARRSVSWFDRTRLLGTRAPSTIIEWSFYTTSQCGLPLVNIAK